MAILTINSVEFNRKYYNLTTYKVNDDPIVVDDYRDANYDRHITEAPKDDISINFTLRQLTPSDYAAAIYELDGELTTSYWNPKDNTTLTGIFKLDPSITKQPDLTFTGNYGLSNEVIWTAQKQIKLIKLRDV